MFKDHKFMSAYAKRNVLRDWILFIRSCFKWGEFTDALYQHLILHCSFIAHYNRMGFYETYFKNSDMILQFLLQFDEEDGCESIEYGGCGWRRSEAAADLNEAMIEVIMPALPLLRSIIQHATGQEQLVELMNSLIKAKINRRKNEKALVE